MAYSDSEYAAKVPELREHFFKKFEGEVADSGVYDSRDIDRIKNDDALMTCYMRSFSGKDLEVDKAAQQIDLVLKFRKEIGVNDMNAESFPKELLEREYLYWKGKNLDNQKIRNEVFIDVLFKIVKHKKGTFVEEVKKHIFYTLEQHHKASPGERITLIFDFTGAGVTNVDLDVVKFIIHSLTNYFPSLLAYILLFEMPFLLSAVWKVIQSWLSEEQKSFIKLIKKADMPKYVAQDQLEEHMIKK